MIFFDLFSLERIGLILGTIGAIGVAISVKEMPYEASQELDKKIIQMVGLWHPNLFRLGLGFIMIGFFFSFLATFYS